MSRKSFLCSAAAVIMCVHILTGCAETEAPRDADAGTEEQKRESDGDAEGTDEETVETDKDAGWAEKEESIRELSSINEISMEETIDWAIWSEGIYCYGSDDLCGYVNEEGDRITSCIYEEAMPFSEGLACVRLGGKYGYIGKNGETVLPFIYDQAAPFREGVAYFSRGGEYGLIDREGNVVLDLEGCDSISSFREGLAYFSVDGRYGYMNKNGEVIVKPVYDDAGYFYDGLAVVVKDGLFGVIGKDGKEILAPEYIGVKTADIRIIAQKGDRLSFFDRDGREISSVPGNQIFQKDDIFYISIDDKTGFAEKSGKIILEPIYEEIRVISKRKLVMVRNEEKEYGVLDYERQVVVPFCYYDSVSDFVNDRAVVELDGKYGLLRYDGTLEMPIEYDRIKLFSDGSMAVWTGDTVELKDSGGNLILSGSYEYLWKSGDGYETDFLFSSGETAKFWDIQGNLISEYDHESLSSAYGVRNTYIVSDRFYHERLLKKGEEEEEVLEEALLTNQITPKIGAFKDIMGNESVSDAFGISEIDIRQWKRFGKLFRMGEENSTVLYFYAEPLDIPGFSQSNSGLYIVRDERAEQLIETSECGGSMGGGRLCLWYDTKEDILKPGTTWGMGGFDGSLGGANVFELKQGEKVLENSFSRYYQSASNYSEETLLKNAELFYDTEDNAYAEENILKAEYVVEYIVNEEQVSVEDYHAARKRYISYCPLDMNQNVNRE